MDEKTGSTSRLEAFSDGVYAIAVTLLVLELRPPHAGSNVDLLQGLVAIWPTYFAFVISFATIFIMWINHHTIFKLVVKADHWVLVLNGLLLFVVTVVPFPTTLIGEYIGKPGQEIATAVYCGWFGLVAIAFQSLWWYVYTQPRLFNQTVSLAAVKQFRQGYYIGPVLYGVLAAIAFVSPVIALALCGVLAIYYGRPTKLSDLTELL